MNSQVITVTGSTGTIGRELVRLLSQSGLPIRAVMRDFNKIEDIPNITWVKADLSNENLLESVLAGTKRLFILTGNQFGFGKIQNNLIHRAEKLGVEYVVKLSALGATPRTKSPLAAEHWQVEETLAASSLKWTILRPHAFMQNWLGEVAQTVRGENGIYQAIGDGKVPFIDARDIAAVAAHLLLHPEGHIDERYVLTGGKAVSYFDLAKALTAAIGRTITYHDISPEEMRKRMTRQGIKPKMIESYLALAAYQKAGGPTERTSDSIEKILGRKPLTVTDFANYYKEYFINK